MQKLLFKRFKLPGLWTFFPLCNPLSDDTPQPKIDKGRRSVVDTGIYTSDIYLIAGRAQFVLELAACFDGELYS